MKDKLIQANGNIQTLIIQLRDIKEHNMCGECVSIDKQCLCLSDCRECKKEYFHKWEELMLEKFIVM